MTNDEQGEGHSMFGRWWGLPAITQSRKLVGSSRTNIVFKRTTLAGNERVQLPRRTRTTSSYGSDAILDEPRYSDGVNNLAFGMEQGDGKGGNGLIEIMAKGEVDQRRRKMVYWLIEGEAKLKMSDG